MFVLNILIKKNNQDPNNFKIISEISEYYFSTGEHDNAFSFLLNNYNKDKEKIKKKLVEFFEILGNEHEATKNYRKKLSSLLFS